MAQKIDSTQDQKYYVGYLQQNFFFFTTPFYASLRTILLRDMDNTFQWEIPITQRVIAITANSERR